MNFLNFVRTMDVLRTRSQRIKQDEEKRKRSFSFAMMSMICALIAVGLAAGGGFLLSAVTENVVLTILFIGFAAVILIGAFVALFWSLVGLVFQLKMNKSAWSWIALALFIASVAGSVIIEIYFVGGFIG
ncbi:MAG: hypothetical protein K2L42_06370 [Clostridia bacterium]|nr:hypothetical protein [Clostridia bacterium]